MGYFRAAAPCVWKLGWGSAASRPRWITFNCVIRLLPCQSGAVHRYSGLISRFSDVSRSNLIFVGLRNYDSGCLANLANRNSTVCQVTDLS